MSSVHIVAKVPVLMYMLQSEPYIAWGATSARWSALYSVEKRVSTVLQKCICLCTICFSQGLTVPGATSARCSARHSVAKPVCPQLQKCMCLCTCCSRSRTVTRATSANVAKRVCPNCCKSVCDYMLQSEPYSARGHFCQVVCDYGMVLMWAIHESKVL